MALGAWLAGSTAVTPTLKITGTLAIEAHSRPFRIRLKDDFPGIARQPV
jgi:hypothetical protein